MKRGFASTLCKGAKRRDFIVAKEEEMFFLFFIF
jgi:hypothetical protein